MDSASSSSLQWSKVHPITPLVNTWQTIAVLLGFLAFNNSQAISEAISQLQSADSSGGYFYLSLIAASIVAILLLIVLYSYISWKFISYAITREAVHFRRGIIFKSEREIKLDRLQAVDVTQPVLGRLFGLGMVRVEATGGADSKIEVGLLKLADAEEVRARVLYLAAGLKDEGESVANPQTGQYAPSEGLETEGTAGAESGVGVGAPAGQAAASMGGVDAKNPLAKRTPVAPERTLYEIQLKDLVWSIVLSSLSAVIWISVVIAVVFAGLWAFGVFSDLPDEGLTFRDLFGISFALLPLLLGVGSAFWNSFSKSFGFKLSASPDGVRIKYGITELKAQTLPPGRVHGLQLSQSFFWRLRDYWKINMEIASYQGTDKMPDRLVPVANKAEAIACSWLIVRDLGLDNPEEFWTEAFTGNRDSSRLFTPNPSRSRFFDWFTYRRNAIAVTPQVLAFRMGWLTREINLVLHEHIQSVAISQGPIQRRLGLADLNIHLVQGHVITAMKNMDAAYCRQLWEQVMHLSQERRVVETPGRWMQRVQQVEQVVSGDAGADTLRMQEPAQPADPAQPTDSAQPEDSTQPADPAQRLP